MTRIGVLADTHGLLRPEVERALAGSDLLLHAGDVGAPEVLERLRRLAPLRAVRGNVDRGAWADALPDDDLIEVGGVTIYLVHGHEELAIEPTAAGVSLVVSGHSHRPALEERRGVIYLNPGSAGPRRFDLPVAFARVRVQGAAIEVEPVELELPRR